MSGRRRRELTRDERALWTTYTRSVARLRHEAADEPAHDESQPVVAPPARRPAAAPQRPQPIAPPLAPLGRRARARVARGRDPIDARLDLHGMTQRKAHAALLAFLRSESARGARLVLVITGKGRRGEGEGERGILRRQVPEWLGLAEFRQFVVGFEDAHIAHGGEGALYVRIRRPRSN